jgi:glycerol kinase
VVAIGITNQRETTLIWDKKTGEPFHNAIVWQDPRTAPFCEELRAEGFETAITQKPVCWRTPIFQGQKCTIS